MAEGLNQGFPGWGVHVWDRDDKVSSISLLLEIINFWDLGVRIGLSLGLGDFGRSCRTS